MGLILDHNLMKKSLLFDTLVEITHMKFYCWIGDKLQHEVAQEDILSYLESHHCMTLSEENRK